MTETTTTTPVTETTAPTPETSPATAAAPTDTQSFPDKAQAAWEVVAEKAAEAGTHVRTLLGLAPLREEGPDDADTEAYTPSRVSTKLFVSPTTNYEATEYDNKYSGADWKILVVCGEDRYLECTNGLKFRTGHHPTELLVPLLHWDKAGFGFDVATPTAAAVALEAWAMPQEDANVLLMLQKLKPQLEQPLSLKDVAANLGPDSPYIAVFIPGGHGAMLGLPNNEHVGQILDWAVDNDKFIISICHGPAAFLASANKKLEGYSLVCFPNSLDKFASLLGYLPGPLPWFMGDKLTEEANMKVVNAMASGATHEDRKLLTGDSPNAAHALGKLAAERMLAQVNPTKTENDADDDI